MEAVDADAIVWVDDVAVEEGEVDRVSEAVKEGDGLAEEAEALLAA